MAKQQLFFGADHVNGNFSQLIKNSWKIKVIRIEAISAVQAILYQSIDRNKDASLRLLIFFFPLSRFLQNTGLRNTN